MLRDVPESAIQRRLATEFEVRVSDPAGQPRAECVPSRRKGSMGHQLVSASPIGWWHREGDHSDRSAVPGLEPAHGVLPPIEQRGVAGDFGASSPRSRCGQKKARCRPDRRVADGAARDMPGPKRECKPIPSEPARASAPADQRLRGGLVGGEGGEVLEELGVLGIERQHADVGDGPAGVANTLRARSSPARWAEIRSPTTNPAIPMSGLGTEFTMKSTPASWAASSASSRPGPSTWP